MAQDKAVPTAEEQLDLLLESTGFSEFLLEAVRVLDEKQYKFDDGPGLTTLRTGEMVQIPDLHSDARWLGDANAISGAHVRSMLAVPISTDNGSGAALNCYSSKAGAFDPVTVDVLTWARDTDQGAKTHGWTR